MKHLRPVLGLLLTSIVLACSSRTNIERPLSEAKLLHDQVDLGPSLKARLTKLVFFGSGPTDIAPLADPIYKNRFEHAVTTKVHPEIHLAYTPPGTTTFFTVTVHIRENGKTFRIVEYETRIEPDWSSSSHSVGVGVFGPGTWRIGSYDADIHINGKMVATGQFEVL